MEYYPKKPPSDPAQLPAFLQEEFQRLKAALAAPQKVVRLQILHSAPEKFGDGDLVRADGTHWNPGSGAGIYERRGAAWVFIG